MQSRERKHHRVASIFPVNPNAAASKNGTTGRIADGDYVLNAPDVPDTLKEYMLIPFTAGDIDRPVDLWRYQELKIREKALVDAFKGSITNIANPTADPEQIPFTHDTIQMIFKQKIDARKAKRLSIHLGKHSVEFRAMSEKLLEEILW